MLRMKALDAGDLIVGSQADTKLKRRERLVLLTVYLFILFYPVWYVCEFYAATFDTMGDYLHLYFDSIWFGVITVAVALFISSTLLMR